MLTLKSHAALTTSVSWTIVVVSTRFAGKVDADRRTETGVTVLRNEPSGFALFYLHTVSYKVPLRT